MLKEGGSWKSKQMIIGDLSSPFQLLTELTGKKKKKERNLGDLGEEIIEP